MSDKLGPTGEFPKGKVTKDDEGEIRIAVASDPKKKVVIIQFGKPVSWIAFEPDFAKTLAQAILDNAAKITENETTH